jgi:hypothetical protein
LRIIHGENVVPRGKTRLLQLWLTLPKSQRAADKQAGTVLEWQQSAADALISLARQSGHGDGRVRRSPTTLVVHLSEDAPPLLEGAGPLSPETAERLRRFLADGHHGEMEWLATTAARRAQPRALWAEAGAVVMFGLNYGPARDPRPVRAVHRDRSQDHGLQPEQRKRGNHGDDQRIEQRHVQLQRVDVGLRQERQ